MIIAMKFFTYPTLIQTYRHFQLLIWSLFFFSYRNTIFLLPSPTLLALISYSRIHQNLTSFIARMELLQRIRLLLRRIFNRNHRNNYPVYIQNGTLPNNSASTTTSTMAAQPWNVANIHRDEDTHLWKPNYVETHLHRNPTITKKPPEIDYLQ